MVKYILASDAITGTHTEGLQSFQLISWYILKEPLGLEFPRIGPVLRTVVHGPVLALDHCLSNRK